ncbi:MAG: hypothetical protein HY897_06520 [Deltaproteobacteria bacterium]|nr:hypothetical protein [Deltaproteobacteria bacterium]
MFVEYCGAVQEKQNDAWTMNYAVGTERFVKKILRENGLAAADPPV